MGGNSETVNAMAWIDEPTRHAQLFSRHIASNIADPKGQLNQVPFVSPKNVNKEGRGIAGIRDIVQKAMTIY